MENLLKQTKSKSSTIDRAGTLLMRQGTKELASRSDSEYSRRSSTRNRLLQQSSSFRNTEVLVSKNLSVNHFSRRSTLDTVDAPPSYSSSCISRGLRGQWAGLGIGHRQGVGLGHGQGLRSEWAGLGIGHGQGLRNEQGWCMGVGVRARACVRCNGEVV